MIKPYLFILALSASLCLCMAQNSALKQFETVQSFLNQSKISAWDEALSKDGVTVSYRDLIFKDTVKTRQLKVIFHTSASLEQVLIQIKKPAHIVNWNEFVKEEKLLKDTETVWMTHTVYDIPIPFSKQDLVAEHTLSKQLQKYIIESKSTPEYISEIEGLEREVFNVSKWIITQEHPHSVAVEFSIITLSNSKIPRFIKDPIIQRKLLNSFIQLKKSLSKP